MNMSTAPFGNEDFPMFRLTGFPNNGSTPKNSFVAIRISTIFPPVRNRGFPESGRTEALQRLTELM